MERTQLCFLAAIKAALKGTKLKENMGLSKAEWLDFFELAKSHHVLPLVFDAVRELPELQAYDFMAELRSSIRHQIFLHIRKTGDFLSVYKSLRGAGLNPIVVKGSICRNLYPNPDYRISSDEDLLIPPEETLACHRLLLQQGLGTTVADSELENVYEIPYRKTGTPLYIELHRQLFPPESEAYGEFNRFFENVFEHPSYENIQGVEIMSLGHSDHLLYLICHSFKHFLHSGFGIRQVCDIVMYAEKYGKYVDWEKLLWDLCSVRAAVFAAAVFTIGSKHLGFDPAKAGLTAAWLAIETDEDAMLRDLLSSGVFGKSTMSRLHSSNITLDAVAAKKRGAKARNSLILSLFPSAKKLENRYPYLKKRPYMLPAAWAQRIVAYGKEHRNDNSAAESLKIGSERVELLRKYDVID